MFTTKEIIDLWLSWDQPEFVDFREKFVNGYDQKTFDENLSGISSMFEGVKSARSIIGHIQKFVDDHQNNMCFRCD